MCKIIFPAQLFTYLMTIPVNIWVPKYGGRGGGACLWGEGAESFARYNRSKQSSTAPDFETCSAHI